MSVHCRVVRVGSLDRVNRAVHSRLAHESQVKSEPGSLSIADCQLPIEGPRTLLESIGNWQSFAEVVYVGR
ncbi:MAG: hypothetical protein H0T64_13225 [Pyrinomonadaceae bacterium]|nr:hypothetical protein [Pyrinomonadaceae bacterium]